MARILVVDDEIGLREFIADVLISDDHEITEASNAHEALHHLAAHAFDLLITDLRMPGNLDGMDLVRKAKSDFPEMEILVLTAYGTVESAVEAMKLGAFDFLQKPLGSPLELRLLVRRALERRRLLAMRDATQRAEGDLPPLSYGDPVMDPVVRAIEKVAPTNATVLLIGESGTGKEVAARTIHRWSRRSDGPFVPINCAAISEAVMEAEVFGLEKGALAGTTEARRGRLELADGGTVFLDEIAELKPGLQATFLRVLQDQRFERIGGTRTIDVDVRWIAATNRDLEALVREGSFREDLYHRIAGFPVRLPPLRQRKQDIVPLAETILRRISAELGRPALRLHPDAEARIRGAYWSGNARELANALERAAILAEGTIIRNVDLSPPPVAPANVGEQGQPRAPRTMAEIEEHAIRTALAEVQGNRRLAAERLGIGVRTLYEKLKRYEIDSGGRA